MQNFEYHLSTKMYFGTDYENRVGGILAGYGFSRILLVYGMGSIKRSGLYDRIAKSLSSDGIHFEELSGVVENPLLSKVYEGISLARKFGAQAVLAVGGGSVIDTAKAIAAGVCYDGDVWDFFGRCAKAVPKNALPVVTVLTIAAAGSETSNYTVITKDDTVEKRSFESACIRPLCAILNPALESTLSRYQTACGISDMCAHLLERYFTNTQRVDLTDRLIEGTFKTIILNAPDALTDRADYDSMAEIVFCGSVAHNGLLGLGREEDWATHKIGHELSSKYGLAHGESLAIMFPAWMKYTLSHNPARMARFAHEMMAVDYDFNDFTATAEEGIEAYTQFLSNMGLKTRLTQIEGFVPSDIAILAQNTPKGADGTIGFYVKLDNDAIEKILLLAE